MRKYYKAVLSIESKEQDVWQVIEGDKVTGYHEVGFLDASVAEIELPEVYEVRIADRKMRDEAK